MASRDFYKPESLLDVKAQARGLAIVWAGVFLFLAGIAFALKIGDEFSRGAILLFAGCGFGCLLAERIAWRNVLQYGLAEHKFSGRNIILITNDDVYAEEVPIETLIKHGLQVKHHFVLPLHEQGSRAREKAIAQVVNSLHASDIHEVVLSSPLDRWPEHNDLLAALRRLPLPVSLIPSGATSEILRRPCHKLGNTISIEILRGQRHG